MQNQAHFRAKNYRKQETYKVKAKWIRDLNVKYKTFRKKET